MRTPIFIPRWVLTVKYGLFIGLGFAVWWTTSPSFVTVTGDPYTTVWAWLVIACGLVAFGGSFRAATARLERVGVTGLACLFPAYALAPIALVIHGDSDRTVYSVVALIVSLLPIARAVQLWFGRDRVA